MLTTIHLKLQLLNDTNTVRLQLLTKQYYLCNITTIHLKLQLLNDTNTVILQLFTELYYRYYNYLLNNTMKYYNYLLQTTL